MPAGRVAAPPVHDLLVDALELSLEATQHLRHSSQSVLQQCWNPVLLGIDQDRRQFPDVPRPDAHHDAELGHQTTQGIDQHRALLHQHFTDLVNPRRRLLRFTLDLHEAHRWPAHRLADRRRIRRVVLVAPHIRLGVGRRNQLYPVPQLAELARPIIRRCTRLHSDQAWRQLGKIDQDSCPTQHPPNHCLAGRVDAVHLEDVLRQVQTDRANFSHGWLPSVAVFDNPTLAHRCREGAIHPIKLGCQVLDRACRQSGRKQTYRRLASTVPECHHRTSPECLESF